MLIKSSYHGLSRHCIPATYCYRVDNTGSMPRTVSNIVDELHVMLTEEIRLRGRLPVLTIQWLDFYELCGVTRFKAARLAEIQKDGIERFGLIVAYGEKVVMVAQDRNFAPPES